MEVKGESALREYLASQPHGGYTGSEQKGESFWSGILNSPNHYSPYQDLLDSRNRRLEEEKRRAMAKDAGTQAAVDEKLGIRKYEEEQNLSYAISSCSR